MKTIIWEKSSSIYKIQEDINKMITKGEISKVHSLALTSYLYDNHTVHAGLLLFE